MSDLRTTHDELLARLSRRQSIFHFAHAAVAFFVAFIASGAAWRFSVETEFTWLNPLQFPALAVAVIALGYAAVRLVLGRGQLKQEDAAFVELKRLRTELKVDEPPALERA